MLEKLTKYLAQQISTSSSPKTYFLAFW